MIPDEAVEAAAKAIRPAIFDPTDYSYCMCSECDKDRDVVRKEARAALTAAAPHMQALPAQPEGWRPIETAPKDGTVFIYQSDDEAVSTCNWQADDCGWDWWDIAGDQIAYPVRWMPLPPAIVADQHTEK